MTNFPSNKQKGVGLIEVLIATVVIAIGLLAVASLQTGFMSSSGDSKTRTEALVLAEQKVEDLRNYIDNDGYDNDIATGNDNIVGTNATFARNWTVSAGGAPDRKNISVQMSWDSDGGVDSDGDGSAIDANEKVNVVTEMTFIDPGKSALLAYENGSGGTGAVPSPRQNASEDVASENVVGSDLAITDLDLSTAGAAGVDATLEVDIDGTAVILSEVAPASHFYTATTTILGGIEPGVIAVFLCSDPDSDGTDTCTHIQNHFGGVALRTKGTVYSSSGNGLSNVLVAWTSSDVNACYTGPITTSGSLSSMPYECVYAGNCNASAAGTRTASGAHSTDPGCFVDAVVSDAQINARNVGPGGEFGDIGLLNLVSQGTGGLNTEQVCFLEDTTDPSTSPLLNTSGSDVLNENYLFAVTKRFYITRRVQRNENGTVSTGDDFNDHKSEGINRSYTNHNFFIVERGSGGTARQKCNTEVAVNYPQQIAPREISRVLNEGTANTVPSETSYSGGTSTANFMVGNVTGSATQLRLFIPETGACYLNNALDKTTAATAYACVVASDVSTAEIVGSSNEHKTSDPSIFASCTKTVDGTPGCHWLANFTNSYNDGSGVTTCTSPWGTEIADAATVQAYSIADCNTAVTLTCTSGALSGDATAIYETTAACTTAAASLPCTLPWGGGTTIDHGVSVDAFTITTVPFGSTCPAAVTRTCNNGTLEGNSSAEFQSCTPAAPCIVPDIDGDNTGNATQLAAVEAKITDAGLVSAGTLDSTLANQKVFNQDPVAGSSVACGSTVTFDYKQ